MTLRLFVLQAFFILLVGLPSYGADNGQVAEPVDIEKLKQKYQLPTSGQDVRVIQNRLYTKAHKLQLEVFGNSISTNPFLSVRSVGGSIGYNFSEYWGLNLMGWKDFVSKSSALNAFESQNGFTVNTVYPQEFAGGEIVFSPVYGKLSLLASALLYFDLHLNAGAGMRFTENGNAICPQFGIGQEIFLAQWFALDLDYRVQMYSETVKQKVPNSSPALGGTIGTNFQVDEVISLGVSFLVGG